MRKIAVVGAGFAGLAAAYFLSEKFQVTLLDQKGIGGGASGVSSGLLHPYPGEKGRLSWHARGALSATCALLNQAEQELGHPVTQRGGILRLGPVATPGSDVIKLKEDQYLITSGITVFTSLYLEALGRLCYKRGVQLKIQSIESIDDLREYEGWVLAIGAGLRFFKGIPPLKVNYVKGQILSCSLTTPLERSISSKVYTALTEDPLLCHIGATYERDEINDIPDQEKAIRLLKPSLPVLGCRAGIRVTNPAHYFPLVEQVGPYHWIITALGSRGLLYHAWLARTIINSI